MRTAAHPCLLAECAQAIRTVNGIYCKQLSRNVHYCTTCPCKQKQQSNIQ